jgi:hypothetical protein
MKLFFAGATHAAHIHVREQIRMTLNTSLVQICVTCMRDWLACVKFHAADHMQFEYQLFYWLRDGIVSTIRCVRPVRLRNGY